MIDFTDYVLVPARLAHRIRLALDYSHLDEHDMNENGETINNRMATELILCEGYPDSVALGLTTQFLAGQAAQA